MMLIDDRDDEPGREEGGQDENGSLRPRRLEIKIAVTAGLVLADMIFAALLIALFACVVALAAVTLAFAIPGIICIAAGQIVDVGGLYIINIPEMPYICSLLLGIALIAMAVVFSVATEHCGLYSAQILRKLIRWNKNTLQVGGRLSPPLPLQPWITPRKRRVMRALVLISIVVFIIALVVCFIAMIITARSLMPWIVWGWF